MICYKDRTYCDFYVECKNGSECDRALTPEVKKDAKKWWGNDNAPIALFVSPPECYVDIYITNEETQDEQSEKN